VKLEQICKQEEMPVIKQINYLKTVTGS